MENFKFIARDGSGQRREGLRRAASHLEVLTWLKTQELTAVSVSRFDQAATVAKKGGGHRRVKASDLSTLCWQLTTMVEGGIPVTQAIRTIAEDIESSKLRDTLDDVSERMSRGEPMSEAIRAHMSVFDQLFYAMILAGESGGTLPFCLQRMAVYYDNRDKLIRKVRGAMAYPIFVVGFVAFIVVMIMTFIIPRFQTIFKQIGGRLPAFTKMYMGIYDIIVHYAIFIIMGLIAGVFAIIAYTRTPRGHEQFSRLVLKTPIFGRIIAQAFTAAFSRTLSTLLEAGVPVLEALNILSGMSANDVIRAAVLRTRENIIGGANISTSMAASGFFPKLIVKMVQVGEESGSLPVVLDKTAEYYERRVDSLVATLTSILEPMLIIIVGAIVLVTVLALYLPIFSISDIKQ